MTAFWLIVSGTFGMAVGGLLLGWGQVLRARRAMPDPRHPSQHDVCPICAHPMSRHQWITADENGDFFCQDCPCDGSPCVGFTESGLCTLPLGHKEPCQ